MAAVRALESQRSDRLFEDPYSALLAGDDAIAQVAPAAKLFNNNRSLSSIVVRTRFFDDFLTSLAPHLRQVVILGAGMDTRAFRLPWHPDTHLYELDCSEVLQTKESLLKNTPARCDRHIFSTDLRQSWSDLLINEGYQTEIPSIWLLEGLLYYLNENEVHELLSAIALLSASGSWLGADLFNEQAIRESKDKLARYWHYGCEEPEALLATYGWEATVIQLGDEAANFGRISEKFPPRNLPNVARYFFVTAKKN
jgi:methyltransferase (TIGR00027 family)